MFKILLRDVVSGQKKWYNNCYYNGELTKNTIILWSPEKTEPKRGFKILAWTWQGIEPTPNTPKQNLIIDIADDFLALFNFPDLCKEEFRRQRIKDKMNARLNERVD